MDNYARIRFVPLFYIDDFNLPITMKHTLEISSIRLLFGERLILSDIFLTIHTGEIVGLLGRNGTGKSCLMRVIMGILKAEKSICVDNQYLHAAYKQPKLIRYLPQHRFIPKSLTMKRVFSDFDIDFSEFTHQFAEFSSYEKKRVNQLSGGMFRLLELYLIIKSDTQFVLLDEPFTHISPPQIKKIKALIDKERTRKGFFITDHMYRHILDVCDKTHILTDGKMRVITNRDDSITQKDILYGSF